MAIFDGSQLLLTTLHACGPKNFWSYPYRTIYIVQSLLTTLDYSINVPSPLTWKMTKLRVSHHKTRLRVVSHFSSGIVERAEHERAWKSPHTRKGHCKWLGGAKIWHLARSLGFSRNVPKPSKHLQHHLPPTSNGLGLNSVIDDVCGLSLLFVLSLTLIRGYFFQAQTPVFPSPYVRWKHVLLRTTM